MASTLSFELRRVDGTPADPPSFQTVAPSWRPGDTIPLGRRTLRVVEVRDGDDEHPTVLVVEPLETSTSEEDTEDNSLRGEAP